MLNSPGTVNKFLIEKPSRDFTAFQCLSVDTFGLTLTTFVLKIIQLYSTVYWRTLISTNLYIRYKGCFYTEKPTITSPSGSTREMEQNTFVCSRVWFSTVYLCLVAYFVFFYVLLDLYSLNKPRNDKKQTHKLLIDTVGKETESPL